MSAAVQNLGQLLSNREVHGVDCSQSLFYFVPQEKGLIRRPCWGWKNMGELDLHYKNWPPRTKRHWNGWGHMPRVQEQLTELIFVHFSGRGDCFSEGHLSVLKICCKTHQATLPLYIDMYKFWAFPSINHKIMWNYSFLITSIQWLVYYSAWSKKEKKIWLCLWAYDIPLFSD